MPDGDRLWHGDFHPTNILGDPSRPLIIDWPDARRGDPAADVCRSYLSMKLHVVEIVTPYLDAYCRISGLARETVLRWLPYVAAAKLAEGVLSELDGLLKIVRSSPGSTRRQPDSLLLPTKSIDPLASTEYDRHRRRTAGQPPAAEMFVDRPLQPAGASYRIS
jgi:hypothetical protein